MLALTYQALGRPKHARETLDNARTVLLERHAIRILPNLGAFQAELDRWQGHLAEAAAWAEHVDPGPLTFAMSGVDPRLAQARVLLALNTSTATERAAALLAELRVFCERIPNRRFLLEVEALTALLYDRRGETEAALQTLERVVLAVAPEGWVRLFVDLGEPMTHLLRQLETRRVAPHAIARILAAFPAPRSASHQPNQARSVDPLSQRELEILGLLARRESNKEIAAGLYITPGTVKRHTQNIYRKLQVNDRREAVEQARELGVLPWGETNEVLATGHGSAWP